MNKNKLTFCLKKEKFNFPLKGGTQKKGLKKVKQSDP